MEDKKKALFICGFNRIPLNLVSNEDKGNFVGDFRLCNDKEVEVDSLLESMSK
jgi:hypothetical protein